jgi:predicted metal-dependent enzyme (double-stranded beta helix superfamily)
VSTVSGPADAFEADYPEQAGTLSSAQLVELARAIAEDRGSWEHLVDHDPDQRTYALLRQDEHVTVWLICWSPGHDTGFHDHDVSSAGVALAEGAIVDERLTVLGAPIARRLDPDGGATIEPSEIHRMHHPGGAQAVSIHAYSPPLLRTGAYEVADDGRLLRHAQPGEDALAPVGASA